MQRLGTAGQPSAASSRSSGIPSRFASEQVRSAIGVPPNSHAFSQWSTNRPVSREFPPVASTRPSGSTVSVWKWRAKFIGSTTPKFGALA
jgi:hypothetical protein